MTTPANPRLAAINAALAPAGLRLAGPGESGWVGSVMLDGELCRSLWVCELEAPTQASADALAASLWTAGEAVGDPWVIAQGVPVGRGAAPLSGPCCEEPAQ